MVSWKNISKLFIIFFKISIKPCKHTSIFSILYWSIYKKLLWAKKFIWKLRFFVQKNFIISRNYMRKVISLKIKIISFKNIKITLFMHNYLFILWFNARYLPFDGRSVTFIRSSISKHIKINMFCKTHLKFNWFIVDH
jgi:hypothetical protein